MTVGNHSPYEETLGIAGGGRGKWVTAGKGGEPQGTAEHCLVTGRNDGKQLVR